MKTTAKNLVEFFKNTKSECNFTVIAFDAETKKRTMLYGGFELMHALREMAFQGAQGHICILTNKEGYDFVNKFEETNHTRVSFNDMKPYKLVIDQDNNRNYYMRSGSYL